MQNFMAESVSAFIDTHTIKRPAPLTLRLRNNAAAAETFLLLLLLPRVNRRVQETESVN